MGNARRSVKRVCFVTGTRAEFGLMETVLHAIRSHPGLELQIITTGMHLSARHGRSIDEIRQGGWKIDQVVPWRGKALSSATGLAMAGLARAYAKLKSEIVLVVGDRVEAFAAAAAGHLSQRVVAHVHGGDRALGQVDDALRHSITKLAHIHFPATKASARRIEMLGEDRWRIYPVGAPGIDGIRTLATSSSLSRGRFALVVLHPADADEQVEYSRARLVLRAVEAVDFERIVIVHPNNDPGNDGIARCWAEKAHGGRFIVHRNVDRPCFLGLMRDCAVLVGNSSSGIIEAASFGTPVIDIGSRQEGRERSENVTNVPYRKADLQKALQQAWNHGNPRRFRGGNVYGGAGTGRRIARILAGLSIYPKLLKKLIAY